VPIYGAISRILVRNLSTKVLHLLTVNRGRGGSLPPRSAGKRLRYPPLRGTCPPQRPPTRRPRQSFLYAAGCHRPFPWMRRDENRRRYPSQTAYRGVDRARPVGKKRRLPLRGVNAALSGLSVMRGEASPLAPVLRSGRNGQASLPAPPSACPSATPLCGDKTIRCMVAKHCLA
jgi:hypothetical protein